MFNPTKINIGGNSQTIQLNAPSSGILQRSHPKSSFIRFQRNSTLEGTIFPTDGSTPFLKQFNYGQNGYEKYKDSNHRIEIMVLQILIFGNDYYLVEIVELQYLNE